MTTPTPIVVTGVTTGISPQAGPPPRRSIFDVVNDQKTFSLLVQGLTQMQEVQQNEGASHFQIGGIHGKPYVEWNGSGGSDPASKVWEGYCTHGTVLFPIWHRPYVTLYEQVLQAHIVRIADKYTDDKLQWQNAAANFRLPFWDWASKSVPPPQVLSQQSVDVVVADGSTKSFTNPLYSYKFHPRSDGGFDFPWNQWNTTLRCPTDETPDAQTDYKQVIRNLTGPFGAIAYQLRKATYILLTQNSTWLNMSNHTRDINPSYASSLEAIHDRIHNYVGSPDTNGHMSDSTVAGHDPIFYLHHCNVDRLLALWQAINYDSFVPPSTSLDGTWIYPANTTVNASTELAPFLRTVNSYWNSDQSRDIASLGYTYPEFVGLDLSNKPQVRSAILAQVNALYGSRFILPVPRVGAALSPVAAAAATTPDKPTREAVRLAVNAPAPAAAAAAEAVTAKSDLDQLNLVDWRVRVLAPKYKLGGPYSIFIFLGSKVPEQVSEWRGSEELVGTVEVFAPLEPEKCSNCRRHPELIIEGTVYLNLALLHSSITSFEPDVVDEYLKENLHWRVTKKGQIVDIPSKLPELSVSVVEVPIQFTSEDEAPHRIGNVSHHTNITTGRDGGAEE